MKKMTFSPWRTLTLVTASLLGFFMNLGIILYFYESRLADFTYIQWAYLGTGIILLSLCIQYVLINVIKKYMS